MRNELSKSIAALPVHQQECVAAFIKGWREQAAKPGAIFTKEERLERDVERLVGYYQNANRTVTPLRGDL